MSYDNKMDINMLLDGSGRGIPDNVFGARSENPADPGAASYSAGSSFTPPATSGAADPGIELYVLWKPAVGNLERYDSMMNTLFITGVSDFSAAVNYVNGLVDT